MSDDELRDQLRRSDPVAGRESLRSAETTRLLEDAMAQDPSDNQQGGNWTRRRVALATVAAAIVVVGLGGALLAGGDDTSPAATDKSPTSAATTPVPTPTEPSAPAAATTELTAPAAVSARCAVPTPELLASATAAFDGVVENIVEDQVSLAVSRVYTGDVGSEVVVTATPESIADLISATRFEEGERYLVSAVEGQLTVCGFSGPYSADLEQLYVAAFGA